MFNLRYKLSTPTELLLQVLNLFGKITFKIPKYGNIETIDISQIESYLTPRPQPCCNKYQKF